MTTLRSNLIRLASTLPKGDTTRREILSALNSGEILWNILSRRAFFKLYDEMEKAGDKQSAELLREVTHKLAASLALSDNEEMALNRLRGSLDSIGRWDVDLQRNNIFKAANLLGIKLPSHMFG